MTPKPPPLPTFSFTSSPSLSPLNVPVVTYLASHPEYEAICTASLIFTSSTPPKILLVQRAAHDSSPNTWEVPGGGCDDEDPSILHAAVREVWEESGLKVTMIRQLVGEGYTFITYRKKLKVRGFSFLVEVESTEGVKLDPEEHQEFLWASEEECRRKRVVREDGEVVEIKFTIGEAEGRILEGFRLWNEGKGEGKESL
jgi:8-oxo-dGTP pyrophosphatase MutT (NUDIX family)